MNDWGTVIKEFPTKLYLEESKLWKQSHRKAFEEYCHTLNYLMVGKYFDIMGWWKENGRKFQKIFPTAVVWLTKPATNAFQERVFSTSSWFDSNWLMRRQAGKTFEMHTMECLTRKLWNEIQKNEEKLETLRIANKKERREKGEKVDDEDDVMMKTQESNYVSTIGKQNIITLTTTLKEYNKMAVPTMDGPVASFPQFLPETAAEVPGEDVVMEEAPDEVKVFDLSEMEAEAEKDIPELNIATQDVNDDEDENKSTKSDDTNEIMERLQRQSRQLVSFEKYVHPSDMVPTDEADDDKHVLDILENDNAINIDEEPPIGVVASEHKEILDEHDGKPTARSSGAKRQPEATSETSRKQQRTNKSNDVHTSLAKSNGKSKSKSGKAQSEKVQSPKHAPTGVAKKTTPKSKTTQKAVGLGEAKSSSAKRTLTSATASKKKKSSAKQSSIKPSRGTQKSPSRKAREGGK